MIKTEAPTIRYMQELVPEGVDPARPGTGTLEFEPKEAMLTEVLFNVQDEAARTRFLAAALGVDAMDRYWQWADLAVNIEKNAVAPVIFRPAAIA